MMQTCGREPAGAGGRRCGGGLALPSPTGFIGAFIGTARLRVSVNHPQQGHQIQINTQITVRHYK